ncbi:MAG: hypothetical protein SF123_21060 [Chloroflexota bacterium]|nr:hypothetical protein [Chloroflexota bacterium]
MNADLWEKTYLDAHEYIFRLMGLMSDPVTGTAYHTLELHAFTNPCLITLEMESVPTISLHITLEEWTQGQRKSCYNQVFDALHAGAPPPDSLPDSLSSFSERHTLKDDQTVWIKQHFAALDVQQLVTCGDGFAKDGYSRRGWIVQEAQQHSFDDYGGTYLREKCDCPVVFSFFKSLYQLASSVMRKQESIAQLRSLKTSYFGVVGGQTSLLETPHLPSTIEG